MKRDTMYIPTFNLEISCNSSAIFITTVALSRVYNSADHSTKQGVQLVFGCYK
jgi:hypothetical protein